MAFEMDAYTGWLIFGTALMILEIVVPGVFLLWIGLAGLLTGGIVFLLPSLPFAVSGSVFAVFSVVFAWAGNKLMTPVQQKSEETSLNNRMELYMGKKYQVSVGFADGRGKIKIGDTVWNAFCTGNPAAGQTVTVVGFDGTALKVEPVDE